MNLVENAPLAHRSAMACGGTVAQAAELFTEEDVRDLHAFAKAAGLPCHVFGEGTNTLFGSGHMLFVAGFMKMRGIEIMEETVTYVTVRAAAGEIWDDLVEWSVSRELSGIESLSHIPGTVGAAPVQNIGAYGSELRDTCESVRVYDNTSGETHDMPNDACAFGYRDSIFKRNPGRFIVLAVTFVLSKDAPRMPTYAAVQQELSGKSALSGRSIRDAVIAVRARKLPHYRTTPNLGSFFKNPIIDAGTFRTLLERYPEISHTPTKDGMVKVHAGWLIERVGLRGADIGGIKVHEQNALVLTNPNRLPYEAVAHAELHIVQKVHKAFGITLEREPMLYAG